MQSAITRFSPQVSGLNFVNRFGIPAFIQWVINLFRPGAPHIPDMVYGLCGGMVFSALDYFYANKPRPAFNDPQQISPWMYLYLVQRQVNSLSVAVLGKIFTWMQADDLTIANNMITTEIPALRSSLDQNNPAPLVLIRCRGGDDPTHNHQVLAIGYQMDDASHNLTIDLYDPNHPGMQPSLSLNLSNPAQGIQIAQSTGETLRGFFVTHYEKHSPL
jgi:hypothetical protein